MFNRNTPPPDDRLPAEDFISKIFFSSITITSRFSLLLFVFDFSLEGYNISIANLKSQPFFPCQNSVHPSFFISSRGIESGKGSVKWVHTDTVINKESFQCLSATCSEKYHALVKLIKNG